MIYKTKKENNTGSCSTNIGKPVGEIHYTNNIFIGKDAGMNATTGSDNILIGHDIQLPTPETCGYVNILGTEINAENKDIEAFRDAIKGLLMVVK